MIIVLAIFFAVCLCGAKFAEENKFHTDYMSKENTGAVNGIFVVLVFLRHFSQYVKFSDGLVDQLFVKLNGYMGQLLVTTFLFYSGYGIMCSIMSKGSDYVRQIPKKRILSVLIHFDIAVALFLICDIILGKHYDLKTVLLAFTGWTSIGNSNWYIFAVIILYFIVFLSFTVFKKSKTVGFIMTTALTVMFVFVMIIVKRPDYCYNTVICYPLGMLYALLKEKIDKALMKNDIIYFSSLAICFAALVLLYRYNRNGVEEHSMWSSMFAILVVMVSMKVKLNNPFIKLMGNHVFGIYILQRIPMMIFANLGIASNRYVFLILSFLATLPLTFIFDRLMAELDKKLILKK